MEKWKRKFPPYRRRGPLPSHSFSTFIRIFSRCQHLQLHNPEQVATVQADQLVKNDASTIHGDRLVVNKEIRSENGFLREKSLFSLRKTDALAGASKSVDSQVEKSLHLETDKTDMQMTRRESDEPLPTPDSASSSFQKNDGVIGDGDISENSGVPRKSSDLLHEDNASLENNIVNKGHVSGVFTQKEGFSRNALSRDIEKENKSGGLSRSELNTMSTAIDVQMGTDTVNLVENRSELVYYGDIVADERAEGQDCNLQFRRSIQRCALGEANSQSSCPKVLTPSGGSTGENTVDNQCSASTQKVTNLTSKKRKRGPGSEDRKARKKKKERMKRGERNRNLGVKKLKLPPVTKPKTIKYCRHFVKGRCHEGEKCKFSHDAVPLTKSKSCMKGDDCSYDHQLSKYPCNSYLSTGSCSRGSNCVFSHDVVPVKECSSAFEQQSLSVRATSNFKKPTSKQNVNDKSYSSGISLSKNEKHNGPADQAPKGLSFFSHEKVPLGNMSENGQGASSLNTDNVVKVDQQRISGASDLAVSLNKDTQRTPDVPPRRVNFLSFGKASLESRSRKRSSFLSISNVETGNSPLSDPYKRKHAGSSLNTGDGVKFGSQIGQGTSSISQNLNEPANRTPAMTPGDLRFISADNHLHSSFNKKLAGSHLNESHTVQPTDKINASVDNKGHSPSPVLPQVSASLPREISLSKLIDAQSKSSLNASQRSFLSNSSSSVQKAVCSTLTLAAKFEAKKNKDRSYVAPAVSTPLNKEASSSHNQSTKAATILDLLFGVTRELNEPF
ncbi:uncharacterized protein LOC141724578 isoform X2 [Apium graveolens]|uniref:uncharacterized protein LOC141724578 isoform X2 n=1 Tax=Apium graveolens TaxID=4045 RepID=UPI003D7B4DC0